MSLLSCLAARHRADKLAEPEAAIPGEGWVRAEPGVVQHRGAINHHQPDKRGEFDGKAPKLRARQTRSFAARLTPV